MKKIILSIVILIMLGFFFYFYKSREADFEISKKEEDISILKQELSSENDLKKDNLPDNNLINNNSEENIEEISAKNLKKNKAESLPRRIHLEVDFASQAPFAVWDELHEESCEEASLITVYYYLEEKELTKEKMEEEIQALVKYQNKKYGDYKDSDMTQLKKIAQDYYEIENIKLLENFEIEDLKKYLADDHLIIIPTAGRELGNPNFTPPGPLYHNLVLIGYDDERGVFITNDPGTRKGNDYVYDYEILYNAIHDFPGKKSEILEGGKVVLVF